MKYLDLATTVLATSFKIVKTVNENISDVKKIVTQVEETISEGKNVSSKIYQIIGSNKNAQSKSEEACPIIPKPASNNKADIYNWILDESKNIHSFFVENLRNITFGGKNVKYPNITFFVEEDKLLFSVHRLSEWNQFRDSLLLTRFALEVRLEKINEYKFDEEDQKRINSSIKLFDGFHESKSNIERKRSFYNTDKLLAAYYYREFLNIFLFDYLRTQTIEEEMILEEEKRK